MQRDSLDKDLGQDGKVNVYLDLTPNISHPESQIHCDLLVEELRDRLRLLEEQLQQANDRDRENRRIIAALMQWIPEIEAPREHEASQEPPEGPQSAAGGRGSGERTGGVEAQEGAELS